MSATPGSPKKPLHDPIAPPERDPPNKPMHDPPGDPTFEPPQPLTEPTPNPASDPPPGGRLTTLAAVRSEHLATFPDAGPREEGTAADTAPAPDVRRTVMRGGRRYNMDTAGIGRGRSTPSRREARPQTEVARLKRAFYRFQRALTGLKLVAKIYDCFFIGVHSLP